MPERRTPQFDRKGNYINPISCDGEVLQYVKGKYAVSSFDKTAGIYLFSQLPYDVSGKYTIKCVVPKGTLVRSDRDTMGYRQKVYCAERVLVEGKVEGRKLRPL